MRIGFDARLFSYSGIGRHIRTLIHQLPQHFPIQDLVFFVRSQDASIFKSTFPNLRVVEVSNTIYSFQEQTLLLHQFQQKNLDLLHVPHFNVPLGYRNPFITTIHDLTLLDQKYTPAKEAPSIHQRARKAAYLMTLKNSLYQSRHILTVSKAMKKDLVDRFSLEEEKITVIYNAIDPFWKKWPRGSSNPTFGKLQRKYGFPSSFYLTVGLLRPHKGHDRLFELLARYVNHYDQNLDSSTPIRFLHFLKQNDFIIHGNDVAAFTWPEVHPPVSGGGILSGLSKMWPFFFKKTSEVVKKPIEQPHIVLVGPHEQSYKQPLQALANKLKISHYLTWINQPDDFVLRALYQKTQALICPSLQEGFSYPPREALACGASVAVSNIPVHRETLYAWLPTPQGMGQEVASCYKKVLNNI